MVPKIISGHSIYLYFLQESLINPYLAMFSTKVQSLLHASCKQSEKQYLTNCLAKINEEKTMFYCIFLKNCQQLIGALEIRDGVEFYGQLYCWLHQDYWGQGYMQQAITLTAISYFIHKKQNYFSAHVDITNKRSYYALKKTGFIDAGFFDGPFGKQYRLFYLKK